MLSLRLKKEAFFFTNKKRKNFVWVSSWAEQIIYEVISGEPYGLELNSIKRFYLVLFDYFFNIRLDRNAIVIRN